MKDERMPIKADPMLRRGAPAPMRLVQRLGFIAMIGFGLAACETVNRMSAVQSVAELEQGDAEVVRANIASLSEVIERNPRDAAAYNTRGAAYARIGQFREAMADFGRAIELDPGLRAGPDQSVDWPIARSGKSSGRLRISTMHSPLTRITFRR